ncbi:MAG: F0F1 ATP synthase subunit A [Clostridia bacterium]|nr:F0F1 ATP synthase subunit A [Clostridia bacterium]
MPWMDLPITESQINTWLLLLSLYFLVRYLTFDLQVVPRTKRQILAEWLVEKTESLVRTNMGAHMMGFVPFIGAVLALSAFSSLLSLIGLFAPTSDMNVIAGWAVLVFLLITYYKLKCGPLHYLKSFAEPLPFFTPMNIISEIATPVSMAFRHYGNIMSGAVISVLVAAGLQGLSALVFGWLPGWLGEFPILRIGIPAFLSVYFDLFSGCVQAFIFAMLTMLYISGAFAYDDYLAIQKKKETSLQQDHARTEPSAAADPRRG